MKSLSFKFYLLHSNLIASFLCHFAYIDDTTKWLITVLLTRGEKKTQKLFSWPLALLLNVVVVVVAVERTAFFVSLILKAFSSLDCAHFCLPLSLAYFTSLMEVTLMDFKCMCVFLIADECFHD